MCRLSVKNDDAATAEHYNVNYTWKHNNDLTEANVVSKDEPTMVLNVITMQRIIRTSLNDSIFSFPTAGK